MLFPRSQMTISYNIPAKEVCVQIEVHKSKFICNLAHASTGILAKQFIEKIKQQYPDATHNCWAFQTSEPGSTRSIGCSDDGEPHGTAGKPMLNVLCHADVGEVVAVVTRYYGGTKLGTGGLARAYSDGVKSALETLKTTQKIEWQKGTITFEYSLQSKIEKVLSDLSAEILTSQFEDKVKFNIRFDKQCLIMINEKLSNHTKGKLKVSVDGAEK
jgi:uncharacterized YigZ family protein